MRRSLVLIAVVVVALAGCSSPFGSKSDPTATPATVDVGADIASGCWNASQRTLPLSDDAGGKSVPQWSKAPAMTIDPAKSYTATVVTNKGTFVVNLLPKDAPIATNNFVCLARAGFFDGVGFHRIVAGFVIQGGDPTGTGRGGPGYEFKDEPVTRSYTRGTVAMANAGPNTNGSQFFVSLADGGLRPLYTIFGEVTSGMEVVDSIAAVEVGPDAQGNNWSPLQPVTIQSVTITEA